MARLTIQIIFAQQDAPMWQQLAFVARARAHRAVDVCSTITNTFCIIIDAFMLFAMAQRTLDTHAAFSIRP